MAEGWRDESERFEEAAEEISRSLWTPRRPKENRQLGEEVLEEAYNHLSTTFDPVYGGFGPAPKFPLPHMSRGGIWDHVGFGFARYSTDRQRTPIRKGLRGSSTSGHRGRSRQSSAGNSVAALILQRLTHLTGDTGLADLAQRQLDAFAAEVARYPAGHTYFLLAVQWALGPVSEVVVAGSRGDGETRRMLSLLQERYLPQAAVLFHPPGDDGREIEELAPFLREQMAIEGRATAFVCHAYACQAPVHTVEALAESLTGLSSGR